MAETGQRSELGMSGRGISRMPILCCNVLDQRIRKTAPLRGKLMSLRVRCKFGWVKTTSIGSGEIGFSQESEKATKNRHYPCWNGQVQHCMFSCAVVIDGYRLLLVGLFAHDALETFLG